MFDMFDIDFRSWAESIVRLAAENPWKFLYYVLLGLSPFLICSAFLSYKLVKQLEQQEKDRKKKARREANLAKMRRTKAD